MLLNIKDIICERLEDETFTSKGISLYVLRLDKIHPVVSGNKLFKLHYFLEEAKLSPHKSVLTFGGAYSNHLVATAFACNTLGLKSIGIVRGEKPSQLSHTLQECTELGMQLKFISRKSFADKSETHFENELRAEFGDCVIIPEGGYSNTGTLGAALIMNMIEKDTTHVCCAMGTATTVAGLLAAAHLPGTQVKKQQQIIGIPVLKGMTDIEERINYLTGDKHNLQQLHIEPGYHFGGYAKKAPELFRFMNSLYRQHQLPTDFVYTGKMMYAIFDRIDKNYFTPGSKIVCLHTGGLQGNLSLPKGTLTF